MTNEQRLEGALGFKIHIYVDGSGEFYDEDGRVPFTCRQEGYILALWNKCLSLQPSSGTVSPAQQDKSASSVASATAEKIVKDFPRSTTPGQPEAASPHPCFGLHIAADTPEELSAKVQKLATPSVQPETEGLVEAQRAMREWGVLCFGEAHMADRAIRGLRLAEEAIEFAQSVDVPADKVHALIEYVYGRPAGQPKQELGGVAVTMLVAASAINESAQDCLDSEMSRVLAKSPEHFTKRNQQKTDAGFGNDQALSTYQQAHKS